MKKYVIGAAMLLLSLSCPAQLKQALMLHMTSGSRVVYFLDTEPQISFSGQTMVVAAEGESTNVPMEDVDHWAVEMTEFSDVVAPEAKPTLKVYGNCLTVVNPAGAEVNVYALDGKRVAGSIESNPTFELQRGIYVVTISNESFKIAIR